MLPRFLLADNYDIPEKVFIVHTESPRCIVECSVDDFNEEQQVHWIDAKPSKDAVEALMADAEDYFVTEMERIDELYDDDEDFD